MKKGFTTDENDGGRPPGSEGARVIFDDGLVIDATADEWRTLEPRLLKANTGPVVVILHKKFIGPH